MLERRKEKTRITDKLVDQARHRPPPKIGRVTQEAPECVEVDVSVYHHSSFYLHWSVSPFVSLSVSASVRPIVSIRPASCHYLRNPCM